MVETKKQATCAERVSHHLSSRLDDLRLLMEECPECESPPGEVGESGCPNCGGTGSSGETEAGCGLCSGSGSIDCPKCLEMIEQGREDGDGNGGLFEYGLSFDYVASGTFPDQSEGYWRFQISWGGPSDEFRFFASYPNAEPYRIEYWFMDWFDGAMEDVTQESIVRDVWQQFHDVGAIQSEFDQAME